MVFVLIGFIVLGKGTDQIEGKPLFSPTALTVLIDKQGCEWSGDTQGIFGLEQTVCGHAKSKNKHTLDISSRGFLNLQRRKYTAIYV